MKPRIGMMTLSALDDQTVGDSDQITETHHCGQCPCESHTALAEQVRLPGM
ncbi:hypothetical protein I79_018878 [Cricetulus griseus]|uniref:Uncharacterized protein n=1 Tax=Cricetulus griseus TaxID=10029 RepID=G3I5W7_CRIGR|nr:hypothetical protein I79_018878 [Cricetulus griseus]